MNWWHLSNSPEQKVHIVTETEQPSSNKRGGARPGAGRKRSTPSAVLPSAETRRASVVRTAENGEHKRLPLEIIANLEADERLFWNVGRSQGRGGPKAGTSEETTSGKGFGLVAHDRAVGQGRERLQD